jgi:transposase
MSSKARRQFTPAQKAEAVRIVSQSGKPISQIAKEVGLTESGLCNWVKQAQHNNYGSVIDTNVLCHSHLVMVKP